MKCTYSGCLVDSAIAYVILIHVKSAPSFAEEVKNLRNQLGLSQKALARALGVSFATINRWEMGHTEPHNLVREHFEAYKAKMTKTGLSNDPASM